jgi:hypothetical protein
MNTVQSSCGAVWDPEAKLTTGDEMRDRIIGADSEVSNTRATSGSRTTATPPPAMPAANRLGLPCRYSNSYSARIPTLAGLGAALLAPPPASHKTP